MISVLGPLELDGKGSLSPRDRVVFEALVIHAGRSVVPDRLADALWGAEPPPSWAKVVQGSIMRLRRTLGPTVIETTSDGYRLAVGRDDIDAMAFEHLVARARSLSDLGDHERAVTTLEKALALWRGRPFGDLDGWEPAQAEAARLESVRRAAEEAMLDARLQSGDHLAAVAEGEALVSAEPLSERRWALLALALYRSGRQGDALRTVQRARRMLADELGVAPGPELVALEQRLLQQDPELVVTVAAPPHADTRCPYRGLVPYDVDDDDSYFGRDREIETCLRRLATSSFLAVVGPSGCGKSSLVRAGVASRLRRSGRSVAVLTPGHDPHGALAATMATADDTTVLVVDQMEELFAPGLPAEAAEQFLAALVERLQLAPVVVALRADHVGSLGVHPAFARRVEDGLHLVTSMTEDELRAAIEQPARASGLRLEQGLVELLLRDVSGEPGGLPLLSFALAETWANREGRVLTVEGYLATGGLRQAIAAAAERLYEGLPPGQRPLARALFLRLVTPTADGEAVRQRVDAGAVMTDEDHCRVVDAFVRTRLVVAGDDGLEVAHEALVREWPRLRSWLDEDQDGQRVARHLATTAADWNTMGRPESELYRGGRLSAAQEWIATHPDETNPVEDDFIRASSSSHEQRRRKARRTTRSLAVLLAIALVGGGLALVQWRRATTQSRRAGAAARAARVQENSTLASTLTGRQLDLALLLGTEDHRISPSISTEGALEAALAHAPAGLDQLIDLPGSPNEAAVSPDGKLLAAPGSDGTITLRDLATGADVRSFKGPAPAVSAYFSADGQLLAGGSRVGTVTVWNVASGQQVGAPIRPGGVVVYGMFDPTDATRLFTVGNNGEAILWDRRDPDHPRAVDAPFRFEYSLDVIYSPFASVSGDGRLLAIGELTGEGGTTRVWDVATHAARPELPGWPGAFGADHTTLVTSGDPTVDLWDTRTGKHLGRPLAGLNGAFPHAVLSADGHRLAATDNADLLRVYDLDTGKVIGVPMTLPSEGLPVSFLPDGRLVTTSAAGLYEVWRIGATVGPTGVGLLPADGIRAGFVHEGADVVTMHDVDQHALVWDSASGAALGPVSADPELVLDVNPAGTTEAVSLPDGTVGLRDHASGTTIGTLDGGRGGEARAQWDPTGRRLATTTSLQVCRFNTGPCGDASGKSADQTVLVWDVSRPAHPTLAAHLVVPRAPASSLASELFPAFSDDGRRVAVIDKVQSSVSMFDSSTGGLLWSLPPGGQVIQAAFAPDGGELIVAHGDGAGWVVTLLDAASGAKRRDLVVNNLAGAAFARGGHVIATTSEFEGSAGLRLWDTATLQPLGVAMASPGRLAMLVTPSPDGTKVITGTGGDSTTNVWDLDVHHWEQAACRIAGRNLTRAEWHQYLPDQPYRRTCPQWPAST